MTAPIITGEITIFGTDSKPLFTLTNNGAGEWSYQSFRELEESCEMSWKSAHQLERFMDFHSEKNK